MRHRNLTWRLSVGVVVPILLLLVSSASAGAASGALSQHSVSPASTATTSNASTPYVTGVSVHYHQDSLTLQHPGELNIFAMANGGYYQSTGFSSGNLVTATDRAGHPAAAIAVTQADSDNFATNDLHYRLGGVGVSGFQYYGELTKVLIPPTQSNSTLTEKLVLPESALIVVIGLSGGQGNTIVLGGIPGLVIDAKGTGGNWTGVMIGQAQLNSGSYNVTETETLHVGGVSRADVVGIFAFSNSKAGFIDKTLIHVVTTIPVGTSPAGVVYDSGKGEIFVHNTGSSNVSVINDTTNQVVATIPVGNSAGIGFGYNQLLAYDRAQGEVFVTNGLSNNVSVISDVTNKVVATISVGTNPVGVAYDAQGGEVFVADMYYAYPAGYSSLGEVNVINDTNNTVVANISVPGDPYMLAYDSAKNELFVSVVYGHHGLGSFVVISCATNTVTTPDILAGGYPKTVVYDRAHGEVFITNSGDTPRQASVTVINDTNNAVVATVSLNLAAFGAAYDSATGRLFVAGAHSPHSTVFVISVATNQVVSTLTAGNYTMGVGYDSGTGELFVANFDSNTVTVISDGTG